VSQNVNNSLNSVVPCFWDTTFLRVDRYLLLCDPSHIIVTRHPQNQQCLQLVQSLIT